MINKYRKILLDQVIIQKNKQKQNIDIELKKLIELKKIMNKSYDECHDIASNDNIIPSLKLQKIFETRQSKLPSFFKIKIKINIIPSIV